MYREELFSYSFLNVKNIIFVILLENERRILDLPWHKRKWENAGSLMLMRIPNKEDSLIKRTISIYVVVSGPVHTYAFLKVWVFVVIENAWSIRVHTLVLSRFDCLH